MTAKKVSFIRTDLTTRGGDPVSQADGQCARSIIQFWTEDGKLVFEYDTWKKRAKVFEEDLL